jgi:hypothetical protein
MLIPTANTVVSSITSQRQPSETQGLYGDEMFTPEAARLNMVERALQLYRDHRLEMSYMVDHVGVTGDRDIARDAVSEDGSLHYVVLNVFEATLRVYDESATLCDVLNIEVAELTPEAT